MQTGDKLHGFSVNRVRQLSELKATLYELTYDKNGARLLWLDRDDDNMTFAIAFKTPPRDDTGVFHIIEHSVLCGSDKYPVKDPFVVLLKSSLQTFLNAITFSDKTVYPVSSRNKKDFLNLMDVYLDAVLHPLSAKDPHAFLQEGWHYELSDDGTLTRNGVVYNEMKGSFSNPDTVMFNALEKALFPDTCYGFVSGGDPAHIPDLTYETYCENLRRCYHPSNAYIFLDGKIDLDAVLSKLDNYLGAYDATAPDTEITVQKPIIPPQSVTPYEIAKEEAVKDRVLLCGGYVYGTYDDIERQLACEILTDVLTGTNDAPLKKALLEKDLCEDVELDNSIDLQQPFMSITLRNTSEEKAEQCWQTVNMTLRKIADEGFDRSQLHAAIDHLEFIQREKDAGRTPLGLIFGINALETWLYGGDPARKIELGGYFDTLRRMADSGAFEKLVREVFLENDHCARVLLQPDKDLGKKREQAKTEALQKLCADCTPAQLETIRQTFAAMRRKQEAPDAPDALAKIPRLSLRDIPEELAYTGAEEQIIAGRRVIHTAKNTDGISYLTLYFTLEDLTAEQISEAEFLSVLLGEIGTERYTATELFTQIQATVGHLSARLGVYSPDGKTDCDPYFEVSIAVLEEKKDAALALLQELLLRSDLTDQKSIFHLLRQETQDSEQAMLSSGHSMAVQRAIAALTAGGAVGDAYDGIFMLRWLQSARDRFEKEKDAFCASLAALCKRIFTRDRLTFALTGQLDAAWLERAAAAFPEGRAGARAARELSTTEPTGIQIPAQTAFVGKALDLGADSEGSAKVASKILSLDHLWNEVRVKGGAYGTGMGIRLSGVTLFYSYRDSHPEGALKAFSGCGDALRRFCDSEDTVDDYIISSIADLQPLMSIKAEGQRNAGHALDGTTKARLQKQYAEVLHTKKDDLRRFADLLDEKQKAAALCIIGGKQQLDACEDTLTHREQLQQTPAHV